MSEIDHDDDDHGDDDDDPLGNDNQLEEAPILIEYILLTHASSLSLLVALVLLVHFFRSLQPLSSHLDSLTRLQTRLVENACQCHTSIQSKMKHSCHKRMVRESTNKKRAE